MRFRVLTFLCLLCLLWPVSAASQGSTAVTVEGLMEGDVNTYSDGNLTLSYEYTGTSKQLSVIVRLFVNGKEVAQPEKKGFEINKKQFEVSGLPLNQSNVLLQLDFVDSSGAILDTKEYSLAYKDSRKNLHFLGIGVGGKMRNPSDFKTLAWPSTDVETIQNSILSVAPGSYFIKSQKILIKEEETNRLSIVNELNSLSKEKLGESDVVMLYLSGHGVYQQGEWFFASRDARLSNLSGTSVSGRILRDHISQITRTGATVYVFVDACQAGGLYESRQIPLKSAFFASSRVDEYSAEYLEWKNSAFAAAFGNALQGKAFLKKNGTLTLGALQSYLYSEVTARTASQHPFLRRAGLDEQSPIFTIPQTMETDNYKTVRGVVPMLISIAPGVGQMYKKEYLKGGLMMGGTLIGVTGIVLCESQRKAYASQLTQTHDINVIRTLDANRQNMLVARNICIGLTAVIYLYNLVDAAVAPGKRLVKVTESGIAYSF